MATNSKKFHGIVLLDVNDEIVCFCSYDDYLQGNCACRDKFDCPEALIEVTVLPGTRPSDKIKKIVKDVKRARKDVVKHTRVMHNSIKKGLADLEKAVRKSGRFKL